MVLSKVDAYKRFSGMMPVRGVPVRRPGVAPTKTGVFVERRGEHYGERRDCSGCDMNPVRQFYFVYKSKHVRTESDANHEKDGSMSPEVESQYQIQYTK